MFRKQQARSAEPTIVGQGATIEGTVHVADGIQIDGKILGNVYARGAISIGPSGAVEGEVCGREVALGGHVEGCIVADDLVHLLSTAHVTGDVQYGTLKVDSGAVIEGRTMHVEQQQSAVEITEEGPAAEDNPAAAAGAPEAA